MRVVVIGTGIFGSSLAYALARAGAEVLAFDEAHAGRATSAGAGIVCPWTSREDDPDFYRFYVEGGRHYRRLIPELEALGFGETGYRVVGGLAVATPGAETEALRARLAPRIAAAPEAGGLEEVAGRDLQRLFPPLRDDLAGFHVPGGARVEAVTVAQTLRSAARLKGATFRPALVALEAAPSGRVNARTSEGIVEADAVVVTAGAWANAILAPLGPTVPVEPQKGQILHLRLEGVDTARWPTVTPMGSHYMLAFDDGRIVVGATRETGAGFDRRVTAGGESEVLDFALALAPGLADAAHLETRIGFRPYHPRKLPMLGRHAAYDNLWIGNGLGAGGLTMGPLSGHLLARLVLGLPPDPNVQLDPQRYGLQTEAA